MFMKFTLFLSSQSRKVSAKIKNQISNIFDFLTLQHTEFTLSGD